MTIESTFTPHFSCSFRVTEIDIHTLSLVCGRTDRNNTPSEVLVFHQALSTPKASYIGRIPSSAPQGRARIIHIFPPGSNNENEFTILSQFHTTRVLRNTLLQYQVQSAKFKQRNYNKHLIVEYKDPSVPTRIILHTKVLLMRYLQ